MSQHEPSSREPEAPFDLPGSLFDWIMAQNQEVFFSLGPDGGFQAVGAGCAAAHDLCSNRHLEVLCHSSTKIFC